MARRSAVYTAALVGALLAPALGACTFHAAAKTGGADETEPPPPPPEPAAEPAPEPEPAAEPAEG